MSDYKTLVDEYFQKPENAGYPKWDVLAQKIKDNYQDGNTRDFDETVEVFVETIIGSHYGWKMPLEFGRLFGIEYNEDDSDVLESACWDCDQLQDAYAGYLNEHKPNDFPKGDFYIDTHEGDGSMCLFFLADMPELPFSEWRRDNGYFREDEIRPQMICDGHTEEEITDCVNAMVEEYEAYCETNKYVICFDED